MMDKSKLCGGRCPYFGQFRVLFEQSPASITIVGVDGKVVDCNPATEALSGYAKADIVGKAFTELLTMAVEDLPELMKQYELLLHNQVPIPMDIQITRQNGELRWLSVLASILRERKKVTGFLVIGTDITDRKLAEMELQEAKAKLRTLIDSSPDAITVTNLEGTIVDCNQATLELHHFNSREELIGKSAFIFFPSAEMQRATENLKKTLEQGIVRNVEYTLRTQDGQEFPAELSASVIRDTMGNPTAFIAITTNITERKQKESQLKVALEQIQVQNEELKEVDRVKEEFYANVSHEYRTPLIAIRGFVELLLQSPSLTVEQKGDLEIVLRNEQRLEQVVNSVLEYSRLKAGHIELKRDRFCVSAICDQLEIEIAPLINTKRLEIVKYIQPDDEITLDQHYITSVIKNLLTNAIKFSFPNGQIIITSTIQGGVWTFSMRDFGIGIPKEDIPKIFNRFVKLQASELMNPDGIGIGLTICKRIINLYGGKIWVESEGHNKGSIFSFRLNLEVKSNLDGEKM